MSAFPLPIPPAISGGGSCSNGSMRNLLRAASSSRFPYTPLQIPLAWAARLQNHHFDCWRILIQQVHNIAHRIVHLTPNDCRGYVAGCANRRQHGGLEDKLCCSTVAAIADCIRPANRPANWSVGQICSGCVCCSLQIR